MSNFTFDSSMFFGMLNRRSGSFMHVPSSSHTNALLGATASMDFSHFFLLFFAAFPLPHPPVWVVGGGWVATPSAPLAQARKVREALSRQKVSAQLRGEGGAPAEHAPNRSRCFLFFGAAHQRLNSQDFRFGAVSGRWFPVSERFETTPPLPPRASSERHQKPPEAAWALAAASRSTRPSWG